MAWNQPKWSDNLPQLEKDIEAYFKHCSESREIRQLKNGDIRLRQESPSMVGLANWLDVDKSTIYRYINSDEYGLGTHGHSEDIYTAIRNILTRAKQRIEQSVLDRTTDGDCDPRIGQMILSHFGYDTGKNEPTAVTVTIAGLPEQASEWAK